MSTGRDRIGAPAVSALVVAVLVLTIVLSLQ
jgi:hypothetical protein